MAEGKRAVYVADRTADDLAVRAKQQQRLEGRAVTSRELAELAIEHVLDILQQAETAGQPITLRDLVERLAADRRPKS